jgi:hypothetical protein
MLARQLRVAWAIFRQTREIPFVKPHTTRVLSFAMVTGLAGGSFDNFRGRECVSDSLGD